QGIWIGVEENEPLSSISAESYPNPFRDETVIRFNSKEESRVTLDILNINGQQISRVFNADVSAGTHEVSWNGTDINGNRVSSGVYFYRLQTGNELVTGKLMLME
ncbi:MAG: T9SS type A sorting domain-containing protein, partial [Bacteroidales bacterium]|nr:T9SS type A sorting domain-containing protein [Bacteroidales bacterium]